MPLKGVRVFIVEDEILIAMELEAILEEAGAEVIGPAYTVAEALAHARSDDISVAVLDLRLGRAPVTPVARRLAERGIPFMFYSGQLSNDPIRAEWPDGTMLSKPARPQQIVRAVEQLIHAG